MKVAADFRSRCFRSILPSTLVLSALSGGVGAFFGAAQAVAQAPSAYAAPTGTAPQTVAAQPTGTAPQTVAAQPTGTAPQTAAEQKSVAARRIAALCEMKNPAIVGEPLSLEKLLYGTVAPSERYRRLAAYWDLVGKRAYCNLCAECANFATVCADRVQKRSEGATPSQETVAFLNASRLVAAQRREAARVDFVRSQHAFDAAFSSAAARRAAWARRSNEAQAQAAASSADAAKVVAANVGTPTSPVLYVPTAIPSADVYETRFDEMSRRRWLSNEAARLNVALPLLYEATRSRAEQARHEWNNLNAAFNAPGTSETVLFAALDRYWAASREMLAAATRYNQAIAAYVAETVPGTLRGAALLATLNQRPSAAASTLKSDANSENAGAAPQNATPNARKTFDDGSSVASASYVAPAAVPNASSVAPTSFVDPAPKPDLTPTPGARLEPADAATPATPAEPLPPTPTEPAPQPETPPTEPAPQPETPPTEPASQSETPPTEPASQSETPPTEPAPQPETPPTEPAPQSETPSTASKSGPSTLVVTGYEPRRPVSPTPPTSEQNAVPPGAAAPSRTSAVVAASFVGRIVRGQAPETPETTAADADGEATQTVQKPQTPPSGATAQSARFSQNAQTPQTANAGARRRVDETVAVLFATPKAEPSPNGDVDGPLEVATTLRSALECVPVAERAATVRAYWRLQEASARVAVESALAQTLTQAFNELNAKASGAEDAAATETARLYLAAALGAQARVAEARIVKRDAQIALTRRTRPSPGQGWPIPATLPFAGPTYRLETPSTTSPTLALEGAVIPENLKTLETIGAAFGPPATLCSFDVSPASASNPLVPLATLEKKRESLLLFIELVVATNVSIAEYVASYPAGFVSVDRFVDALVGPGK